MKKLLDLHVHTTCSDGELSPMQVIDEASNNGVSVVAIADHDTMDAYDDELFQYAKSKNIKVIPAVEISTKNGKDSFHILGYNFNMKNDELVKKLFMLRNARHDYLYNVAVRLNDLGYKVNVEELDKIEAVTKAHIYFDIINNSDNHEVLLKTFGHLPDKGEFIENIMNEGCPAYVSKTTITPVEASKLIHNAGGKVVLAHPVAYKYEDNFMSDDVLKLVQDMQADGIEANYIYVDKDNNKINETKFWNQFAKENNLKATIGSDFHNFDDIHPLIGLIGEQLEIYDDYINDLLDWLM